MDDSPAAEHVLATAFDTAAARHCGLVVIRSFLPAIPLWLTNVRPADVDTPQQVAAERAALEQRLAPWRGKYPDVPVEIVLTHETAVSAMVDASKRARLVIVGSRGHGPLSGILLGSAGLQLLHHAECPVLIARQHTGGKP